MRSGREDPTNLSYGGLSQKHQLDTATRLGSRISHLIVLLICLVVSEGRRLGMFRDDRYGQSMVVRKVQDLMCSNATSKCGLIGG